MTNPLYQQIADVARLMGNVLILAVFAGLILVPVILLGYELQTKRKI